MDKNNFNFNASLSRPGQKIKFSFSDPKKFDSGINETGKFSFKNLPTTQHSLANTDAHYRSRILTEGSLFRQAEQTGFNEGVNVKKGSIFQQIGGEMLKNKQNAPQIDQKYENQDMLLAQSHVLERKSPIQQTKLERYTQVGGNRGNWQSFHGKNQPKNNIVFLTPNMSQQQSCVTTNRTDKTYWIETTIERPKYQKRLDNKAELFRALAPDEDPKMSTTICAPWCWMFWGILGSAAVVLGIIFGMGLLPRGQGSTFQEPSLVIPSKPQANITKPQVPGGTGQLNFIDPVPIDKIPVYTIVERPSKQQFSNPQTTDSIASFIDPQPIAPITKLIQKLPVTMVTKAETVRQSLDVVHSHLTSPSSLI